MRKFWEAVPDSRYRSVFSDCFIAGHETVLPRLGGVHLWAIWCFDGKLPWMAQHVPGPRWIVGCLFHPQQQSSSYFSVPANPVRHCEFILADRNILIGGQGVYRATEQPLARPGDENYELDTYRIALAARPSWRSKWDASDSPTAWLLDGFCKYSCKDSESSACTMIVVLLLIGA